MINAYQQRLSNSKAEAVIVNCNALDPCRVACFLSLHLKLNLVLPVLQDR